MRKGGKKEAKIYTVYGFTGSIEDLATKFGINCSTLLSRLARGWSIQQAVNTPVDKTRSVAIGKQFQIGDFHGDLKKVKYWFGIKLSYLENKEDVIMKKLKRYSVPEFYTIGETYRGSLKAISVDFDCPYDILLAGVSDGKKPEDILRDGGFLGVS